MKLKSLEIELQSYGEFKGRYLGKIKFEDEAVGAVSMVLDPAMANALLVTCSANIVAVASLGAIQLQTALDKSIAEAKQGPALRLTP